MKNIHILPTDKPSRLVKQKYDTIDRLCLADMATKRAEYKRFNLYITSDEEIKEGDWVYSERYKKILQFKLPSNKYFYKKIILTTDQDLIKDGIQSIDDEFLEWFVKNPSCEEVEIISLEKRIGSYDGKGSVPIYVNIYAIIIPKEEHLIDMKNHEDSLWEEESKQETLEETAERFWLNDDSMTDNDRISYVNGFLACSKWQQERSYSEEDMKEAFIQGHSYCRCISDNYYESKEGFEEWFEQFKKK